MQHDMLNPIIKQHTCLNNSRSLNIPSCYWLFYICKAAFCQTHSCMCIFFQLWQTHFPLLYNSRRTCGLHLKMQDRVIVIESKSDHFNWITDFQLPESQTKHWNIWKIKISISFCKATIIWLDLTLSLQETASFLFLKKR